MNNWGTFRAKNSKGGTDARWDTMETKGSRKCRKKWITINRSNIWLKTILLLILCVFVPVWCREETENLEEQLVEQSRFARVSADESRGMKMMVRRGSKWFNHTSHDNDNSRRQNSTDITTRYNSTRMGIIMPKLTNGDGDGREERYVREPPILAAGQKIIQEVIISKNTTMVQMTGGEDDKWVPVISAMVIILIVFSISMFACCIHCPFCCVYRMSDPQRIV